MSLISKETILATKGKFFTVIFVKKDKSLRKMTCRIGVKKGLVGAGCSYEQKDNLMIVYDVINMGYRNVNLETILSFKCGDIRYNK